MSWISLRLARGRYLAIVVLAFAAASNLSCAAGGDNTTGPDGSGSNGSGSGVVQVSGRVFATATFANNSTNYINPVVGALVSTSLDSVTTMTDSGGNFLLVTKTSKSGLS